ncbi:MAG: hypothetical protein DWQ19_11355 [Crenarchaeota archaeon]|nr:MAG: hypothetical protein DWQ19_11355 [Thermoproteota archaeon]
MTKEKEFEGYDPSEAFARGDYEKKQEEEVYRAVENIHNSLLDLSHTIERIATESKANPRLNLSKISKKDWVEGREYLTQLTSQGDRHWKVMYVKDDKLTDGDALQFTWQLVQDMNLEIYKLPE